MCGLCVDVWYFQICFWFWEFPLCSHGDSRHGSGVASTWTRRHQQWVGLGDQTSASETTSTRIFMKKSSFIRTNTKTQHLWGENHQTMSLHLYKIGVTSGKNLATKYPYPTTYPTYLNIQSISNNNISMCVVYHLLAMGCGLASTSDLLPKL